MRHRYGISALVSQTSFRQETSVGVVKCRLFSRAIVWKITFQQQIRPMFVERTKNATRTSSLYSKPINLMLILLFGLVLFVHNNSRLNENRCNETNIS